MEARLLGRVLSQIAHEKGWCKSSDYWHEVAHEEGGAVLAAEILDRYPRYHIVEFSETEYALEHPLECREKGLLNCGFHQYLASRVAPDRRPGRYQLSVNFHNGRVDYGLISNAPS